MTMNNNIEIVDNFLDQEYFDSLVSFFTGGPQGGEGLQWHLQRNIEGNYKNPADSPKLSLMVHLFYTNFLVNSQAGKKIWGVGQPCSSHFETIIPILEKLNMKSMIRVKANLYPYSGETLYEHEMHTDYDFPHHAALLSLNTCDGYTKLKDGTKINNVANRIMFFDPGEEHCTTTTTNDFARFTLNINYIQEQVHEIRSD